MTMEHPEPGHPRRGDQPEERPATAEDVARVDAVLKAESEMARGKNYPFEVPEPQLVFDPSSRHNHEGGAPD